MREIVIMGWPTISYCVMCRTTDHAGEDCTVCPFCLEGGHISKNCPRRGQDRLKVQWSKCVLAMLEEIELNYFGEFCQDVPTHLLPTAPRSLEALVPAINHASKCMPSGHDTHWVYEAIRQAFTSKSVLTADGQGPFRPFATGTLAHPLVPLPDPGTSSPS